jgi:hypothetical protein
MDSRPGNGLPSRRWWVTVTPAESPYGVVEIAGYVIRRCRICGNVPPRQVLKKVLRPSAVVVNDD